MKETAEVHNKITVVNVLYAQHCWDVERTQEFFVHLQVAQARQVVRNRVVDNLKAPKFEALDVFRYVTSVPDKTGENPPEHEK